MYACLSVRAMYLSASCVRVSMLAFVFVHARVRAWGRMCESIRPPVRPFVCLSVCLPACMFVRPNVWSYMRAFINVCVRVFACTRAWGRMFGSVRPSVCLSACMFVRPNVCSHMRKRIGKMFPKYSILIDWLINCRFGKSCREWRESKRKDEDKK